MDPEPVLTREHNPYKKERVMRIIQEVTVGPDIMDEQRQTVHSLLEEYADCFTLSIKEVNAIPGAVHKLNIPEGPRSTQRFPQDPTTPINEPLWTPKSMKC